MPACAGADFFSGRPSVPLRRHGTAHAVQMDPVTEGYAHSMMILYSGPSCPFSHMSRIVLNEKGCEFEIKSIDYEGVGPSEADLAVVKMGSFRFLRSAIFSFTTSMSSTNTLTSDSRIRN